MTPHFMRQAVHFPTQQNNGRNEIFSLGRVSTLQMARELRQLPREHIMESQFRLFHLSLHPMSSVEKHTNMRREQSQRRP
jgi:hypothetical protein